MIGDIHGEVENWFMYVYHVLLIIFTIVVTSFKLNVVVTTFILDFVVSMFVFTGGVNFTILLALALFAPFVYAVGFALCALDSECARILDLPSADICTSLRAH